ncbi:hypothetical protein NQZ79_g180 [Umbelopsis isabellina]|nr:hypothetical protein NQZ79_g180 [Umbelopsis isabellina]
MTQFTAGETSMYEEVPTPPSQEFQNLELPSKPSPLFRNASVPSHMNGAKESNHPPLRPYKTTMNAHARKRSREDSGETSTDSGESTSTPTTTRPVTNQSSFSHETKRRTTDKSFDTITADPFVTAQSISSEVSSSVDGTSSKDQDSTAQSVPDDSFKQPITPLKTQSPSEPNWEAHPEAWGYLKSLNSEYPSAYLEKTNETDGNGRAGYMLGRSERCELRVNNPCVSQRHCLIYILWQRSNNSLDADGNSRPVRPTVLLEDMSRNGTFVNGQAMGRGSQRVLKSGDHIQLYRRVAFSENDERQRFYKIILAPNLVVPPFEEAYSLGAVLGAGNFAQVHIATERETGKEYAVKVVDKERFAGKPKLLASLRKEIAVLMGLKRHSCIMSVENVFEVPSSMYLVLELSRDGDLFDYVASRQRLPEAETRLLIWQLLVGLDYLHANNVVHRDLKLENVLFVNKKELRIKIGDFGLATFLRTDFYLTSRCGTPSYVAPEVLAPASSRAYGKEIDLWSLGVMLYICLCGYPPFSADNKVPVHEIRNGNFTFVKSDWEGISFEARDLIRKLLTVDPARRITVNEAMWHPWIIMDLPGEEDIDPAVTAKIRAIFASQRATMQETQPSTVPFAELEELTSEEEI